MSYTNNRQRRHDSDGSGFRERRGNYSDNRQQQQQNEPVRKHSGCSMKDSYTRGDGTRVDAPVIWGWNKSQSRGFLKFVAVPCENAKTKNSRWLRFLATITPGNGTAKWTCVVLWDIQKQRLHMNSLDMIANPGKDYWGRNYKPKSN